MNTNKKVIIIFGGSGILGHSLFKDFDDEKYLIINISKNSILNIPNIINIKIDLTKKIDFVFLKYKLKSLIEKVDILILANMFIFHKELFAMSEKELKYEFEVNFFSYIKIIKFILKDFWNGENLDNKDPHNIESGDKGYNKCFYISSACSLDYISKERKDLESYGIEKSNVNYLAKYFSATLKEYNVNSVLYLPGSLEKVDIKKEIYAQFWEDISSKDLETFTERVFL